jgi:hypothetical protein
LTAVSSLVLAVAVTGASSAAGAGAARTLASQYAPIVMVRAQDEDPPCDTSREQFDPTTVGVALGNPEVELVAPPGSDEPGVRAPTAADIAGLGEGWYLDLPGNPLVAGCTYAQDFADLVAEGEAPAIAYAHVRHRPGDDALVVQYWFYYYFNEFNDLHESDWEGMQIVFDAASPRAALAAGPSEIGLFQHGGGERADWTDEKVEKDGDHPIVYAAAGSHATFYGSEIYFENGRFGAGVGCDIPSGPLR